MKVTIRIDDELRLKDYWSKVTESQTFEYLKDRDGGIAMLKDSRNRLVSCAKWRVVFPDEGAAVLPDIVAVSEAIETTIDNSEIKDETLKEEN